MNFLDQIVAHKKKVIETYKKRVPCKDLANSVYFSKEVPSLRMSLLNHPDFPVIAEFKRCSPSKGMIHKEAQVDNIAPLYEQSGVAGISILTDTRFFGGNNEDMSEAANLVSVPLLRKDFIIDPYQVYQARAIGASAILLIAAILNKKQASELSQLANDLGMEVLMEIHNQQETELINKHVTMAGINNRNLKTFEVNIDHAANLLSELPPGILPVAESGIRSSSDLLFLKKAGFKGFLIGEYFMKHTNPGKACLELRQEMSQEFKPN